MYWCKLLKMKMWVMSCFNPVSLRLAWLNYIEKKPDHMIQVRYLRFFSFLKLDKPLP